MTGRRLQPLLVASLIAALTASGCTPPAGGTADSSGKLVYATDTQPDCLDPHVSPYDVTAMIDRNIFDSLVSMSPNGAVHPWLASSWTISPTGQTYTFSLRDDVFFHDGTKLDAKSVKTNLDRVVAPETKSTYAVSLIRSYASSTVLDSNTVQVQLKQPDASFLSALSTAYLGIQSPKSLRERPNDRCQDPVGSGPFRFVNWTNNVRVVMERNPDYGWPAASATHSGPPRLPGLIVQFIPEDGVRFGALASGQVDAIAPVPPSKVNTLDASEDLQIRGADSPGAVYSLFLNTRSGPLKDERVRIAVQRSLRLDRLIQSIYFGQYKRAWSPLGRTTVGYSDDTAGSWSYAPELAKRLLDKAGWTGRDSEGYRTRNGERLSIDWPNTPSLMREQRDILGQGVQAELKRMGIHVNYVSQDTGTYTDTVLNQKADMLAVSFVRAEPDILRYLFASDQTADGGGSNFFHLNDPKLDHWLRQGLSTTDPSVRSNYYGKVQQHLLKHAMVVPLYEPRVLVGASSKISRLTFDSQAFPTFYEATMETQ